MTEVTIERVAAGGDGVGRLPDGMTVFVPRTAPGDRVRVRVRERRRRWARGAALQIEERGAGRVEPRCPHYDRDQCGGCQLQHLGEDHQLRIKGRIVGDAVRRIGGRAVADPRVVPSPAAWRYRSKITIGVSGGVFGLHRHDAPGQLFELEDCSITRQRLMDTWGSIRVHRDLLPPGVTSIVLREDRSGGLHLLVVSPSPWDPAPLARAVDDGTVSFWSGPSVRSARVVAGSHSAFPAFAFDQVNPELARRVRAEAVAPLRTIAGQTVWDLYGGVGDTASLLAEAGAHVWSVDVDPRAARWGSQHGPERGAIRFLTGRVEAVLPRLPEPAAVVMNPPRRGVGAPVTAWLDAWGRRRSGLLAYVSCDPATLSRDLQRMPSLPLVSVLAFDLFPQTSHVETLAVLGSP